MTTTLRRGAAVLTCAAASLGCGTAAAADGLRTVTVDASKTSGAIRSLQGVSGTPLPGDDGHPDYTAQFRELGVTVARTHDIDCAGTGDIDGAGSNRIFPDPTADPEDPASYNFAPTDRAVLSIAASGADVEYNLGRSDLRCAGIEANNAPVLDPALYAEVAKHVAMHYNDGWAGGYHLGIRYWEIWNEPDLTPFWSGTKETFYALYGATASALKGLHSWMQVGGPALTTNNDLKGYRESLLAYIRDHHLPLDFWSVHRYTDFTNDPFDFTRLAAEDRALLDSYQFTRTRIHLTEWNYALTEPATQLQRAAFAASSLVLMQDSAIDRAVYHRADREGGPDWALISDDGTLTKTGAAFKAVGSLSGDDRLVTRGGDDQGFSVLSGHRGSNGRGEVRVLISNYEIPPADRYPNPIPFPDNLFAIPGVGTFKLPDRRPVDYSANDGYDLTVHGLRGNGRPYTVRRYRIDADHDLTLVGESVQRGADVHVASTLPAPGVELVVIRPRA